jgi:flagellar biosynthesis protein FlhF
MRLKLFRAANMSAAMARVRDELGPEALILGSRRVAEGIEITAALEPPILAPSAPAPLAPFDPLRMSTLAYHGVPESIARSLEGDVLSTALERCFGFQDLPISTGLPPVLFVGPPGAGKTLTVARLATRLVMAGASPLVITADGKRAGATEQLAAFTRLLGIRLTVADHPVSLSRCLCGRENGAPVLIDAFGGNPFDSAQIAELSALATAAGATIALVLPAGLDPAEAVDLALAFAEMGASLLVATRLDHARRLGGLLAAANASQLPFTEAGIGSGAADGLVPLTSDFLAERLLPAPSIPVDPFPGRAIQSGT